MNIEEKRRKDRERAKEKFDEQRGEVFCATCGVLIPKFKSKYCSVECYRASYNGKVTTLHEKVCVVCGTLFETTRSRKITCSDECSRKNRSKNKKYDPQKGREKYLKSHPNARTIDEIHAEAEARRKEKEQKANAYWEGIAESRAQKEAEKQARIAYWQNYSQEHECAICGEKFIAHYPTTKYCSDKCKKRIASQKHKNRYKGITIDSDITIDKLAKRDNNQCQLCGLLVNWEDKKCINGTIICGGMYPSIDHITPISLGGVHSWDNIQLAHRRCNTIKSNKFIG